MPAVQLDHLQGVLLDGQRQCDAMLGLPALDVWQMLQGNETMLYPFPVRHILKRVCIGLLMS